MKRVFTKRIATGSAFFLNMCEAQRQSVLIFLNHEILTELRAKNSLLKSILKKLNK